MLKKYNLWFWTILYIGFGHGLLAQTLSFRLLGPEQGMNNLSCWNCTIDHYGFYWVATGDGLVRYNGKEITYYYQQDHPEMGTDQIGFVFCDSRNYIWVCSDRGLVSLNEKRQMKHQVIIPDDPNANVSTCFEDADARIYALTTHGVFSLEKDQEKWNSQPWLDNLIAKRRVREIRRFDLNRFLLVLPSAGVILINTKTKSQDAFFDVKGVNCATRFDQKSILIGRDHFFELLHAPLDQPSNISVIKPPAFFHRNNLHEQINSMVVASDHNVYLATIGQGLIVLDSTLTTYTHYVHDPVNPSTLINNSLRFILADSSGSLLITTIDGINFTNLNNSFVAYINYLKTERGEIIDQRVISIAEDTHQRLWICTRDNVLIYDPELQTTRSIIIPPSIKLKADGLSPIYVERDIQGNMWIALRREGIAIFNSDGIFIKLISSADFPLSGNALDQARVIREGHDGFMYFGTEHGLYRIRHDGFTLDTFINDPALAALKKERIVDILFVDKSLWVSSSPGGAIWHYSFAEKKLEIFNERNGLPSNRNYGLTADLQGNIYVGSRVGLSIIQSNDSITSFVKGNGLISNQVESIETADDGTIWITNNYKILKYNPVTGDFFKLGGRQGLRNVNFAIMGSVKLASGKLAFGANNGLVMVDPSRIRFDHDSLKVFTFYTDATGNEIEAIPGNVLSFSYHQNNIRFLFAVSDMILADQALFRYRLESDGQSKWSQPSLNASLDLNLGPGTYLLAVEAYDGHNWFKQSSPVRFIIRRPWWKEGWFLALVLTLIVAAVWTWFKGRIEKFKKELSVTRQIADLESKALKAQMNPHFVFNALNAIQECIVTGKIDEAYTYLSKFSRLLRLVLEHSDVAEVSLEQEIEVLSLYVSLEELRFKDDMTFEFQIAPDLDAEEICIPPMLIQPHLENAIWHGLRHKEGVKTLRLTIAEMASEYLEIIIEDNGIGRSRAESLRQVRLGDLRRKSRGTKLSGDRMSLLKMNYPMTSMDIIDLVDDNGLPTGTMVQLRIPILEKKSEGKNKDLR